MKYIFLLIPLLLDGFFSIIISSKSYFIPLLTVTTIFIIYPYYKKKEKSYFLTTMILGLLYDLLYTNLLFFNAILFLIISYVTKCINKNFTQSIIKTPIYIALIIIIYEVLTGIILFTYRVIPITPSKLLIKISHSLLLNIIYGEILYLIIRKSKK